MPLEGFSLLSRLRSRLSNRTVPESSLVTTASDHAVISTSSNLANPAQRSATEPRLAQKILQNPDLYLDSSQENPLTLDRCIRRHSLDSNGSGLLQPRRPRPMLQQVFDDDRRVPSSTAYTGVTQSNTIERSSKLGTGGEWSTFGRERGQRAQNVIGVSECLPRKSCSKASNSPSGKHTGHRSREAIAAGVVQPDAVDPADASHPSQPSSASSERHPSFPWAKSDPELHDNRSSRRGSCSEDSSPTNTSSKRYPRTPRSDMDNAAGHASPSTHFMTSEVRELDLDSPHTFGHPTPPGNRSAFDIANLSPLPPLPPLDHPALASAAFPRTKSANTGLSTVSDHSETFPMQLSDKEASFPLLSSSFGRALRDRISFPKLPHIFASRSLEHQPAPNRPLECRRTRTVSGRTRSRRNSAEWKAHQAVAGATARGSQGWPAAEVSREILQVSLNTRKNNAGRRFSGSSGKPQTRVYIANADRTLSSPSFSSLTSRPVRHLSAPPEELAASLGTCFFISYSFMALKLIGPLVRSRGS